MALFGSFETDREVYSGPIYTVYSARKRGDPSPDYALKVFSIQQVGFDPEAADLAPLLVDIEGSRIQCIEIQAQASGVSRCIAPVYEKGQDDRGVWYATRFYPRSVNKIILGRVTLTRDALLHVIRSIAQGALDLKRACGRSHGDIVPSNVQISRSEKLAEAEIVISDPLAGGPDEAVTFEINDLGSIGRILLQLVQQRAIGKEDFMILPILPSEQWTSLFGKEADAWLGLCNRLLDPNLSLDQMSLEGLVAELEGLRPKKKFSPKLALSAAGVVISLFLIMLLILRPRAQVVTVSSDPSGATVLLDKKERGITPVKLKLKKGSYILEAQLPTLRLQTIATNIVVPGVPGDLRLQFAYGSVVLKSDPPGASIRSEGGILGKTPADPGGFVIPIVRAGTEVKYELELADRAKRIVGGLVANGQRLVLSETLPLSKDVGTVEIDSAPRGARVFWKDKLLTSATPDEAQLEEGKYNLRAAYKDWPEKQLTVDVKVGALVPASFYFENGLILVESEPSGANVFVGTDNLGPTPQRIRRPAGETALRFELPGFESTNAIVRVADKAIASVRQTLVPVKAGR